VAFSPK